MLTFDTQSLVPWPADGALCVTSTRPNSQDLTESVSVYATYPGAIREAKPSNGVFTLQDWQVTFATDAISFAVKPRDVLSWVDDDGNTVSLTVRQAKPNPMLKYWDVQGFQLQAQADLCDSIAVWRATNTAGSDGYRSSTLAQVGSAILGRLQPEEMGAEPDTDGKLLTRTRYTAYLSSPVTLYAGDVLIVGSVKYEVTQQGDIDALGTFAFARCTRIG